MKKATLNDFLTRDEIAEALKIYRDPRRRLSFATVCCERIIEPNIERINKALGQVNDPMYLAYMVEYAIIEAGERKPNG